MNQQVDEKFIELETKIAYQDSLIEELNEVVTSQQKTIDNLSIKLNRLSKIIAEGADSGIKNASEEEPPPHY